MNDGDSCYKTQLTTTTVDTNGLRDTDCEVVAWAYLNGMIQIQQGLTVGDWLSAGKKR